MHYAEIPIKSKGKTIKHTGYYRCGTYRTLGHSHNPFGCGHNAVKASVLENLVEHYLATTQQQDGFPTNTTPSIPIEKEPMVLNPPNPELRKDYERKRKCGKKESGYTKRRIT